MLLCRRIPRLHVLFHERFKLFFHLADLFAEDNTTSKSKKGGDTKDYVHVRVQQRNGKKSLTTVQGLPEAFDYKKILKALKKGKYTRHLDAR